jgi:hypothetical protein
VGDATKAKSLLRWKPTVSFEKLVHAMVDADIETLASGRAVIPAGAISRGIPRRFKSRFPLSDKKIPPAARRPTNAVIAARYHVGYPFCLYPFS